MTTYTYIIESSSPSSLFSTLNSSWFPVALMLHVAILLAVLLLLQMDITT